MSLAAANSRASGDLRDSSQLASTRIGVVVTDKAGRRVDDLRQDDFLLFEDGSPQVIAQFSKEAVPISYGLIVDATGSMRPVFTQVVETAKAVVNSFRSGDEAFIVRLVDADVKVVADWTSDKKELLYALGGFDAALGRMSIIDSIYYAAQHFAISRKSQDSAMRRRALVVITDGQDNDSRYSMRQLSKLLKELDVQVIAISVYSDPPGAGVFAKSIREDAVALLKDLASKTRGHALIPETTRELLRQAGSILDLERDQYLLGYSSSRSVANKGVPRIEVKLAERVRRQNYSVRTRLFAR
jgi:Ca-activated chloride channel family protein